jgi:hypothetical protein
MQNGPSSPEQAMIPQLAPMNDALSPHTPSPLPADADEAVTGTDIVYLADLQPQPVEWLWQHSNFHWTGLSNLTPGDFLAARPTGAGLPKRKFAAQWLRDCLQQGGQTQGSIETAAERDGVCITTLRRAKFDIGVRNSKDGKSGVWWWTLPPQEDEYPPVNQARWPNKLLGHLGHLRETNDLFGNLAKSKNLCQTNVSTAAPCGTSVPTERKEEHTSGPKRPNDFAGLMYGLKPVPTFLCPGGIHGLPGHS